MFTIEAISHESGERWDVELRPDDDIQTLKMRIEQVSGMSPIHIVIDIQIAGEVLIRYKATLAAQRILANKWETDPLYNLNW